MGRLSECKSIGSAELCTLRKKHPHSFDRLLEQPHSPNFLSIDWERWNVNLHEEDENPYEDVTAITRFTQGSIDKAFQRNDLLVVDAFFPWCAKCKQQQMRFAAVAKQLHKQSPGEVRFGYVDAREEHALATKFNVSCSTECVVTVFKTGESPSQIKVSTFCLQALV